MPKVEINEDAVGRVVADYLKQVKAPKHLTKEFLIILRAAKVYRTISDQIAGEPSIMEESELLALQEKIGFLGGATKLVEHARLEGEAKRRIFDEELLTSSQASKLLGTNSNLNKRQYANKMRASCELLGVPYKKNRYLYPAFQLDVKKALLRPIVQKVNKLLDALGDPWGVASWWITQSERLEGRAPKDLLGSKDEGLILDLAKAELEPVG